MQLINVHSIVFLFAVMWHAASPAPVAAAKRYTNLVMTFVDDAEGNTILSDLEGGYNDALLSHFDGRLKGETGRRRSIYFSFDERLDSESGLVPESGLYSDVAVVIDRGLSVGPGETIAPTLARIYIGDQWQLWFNESAFGDFAAGTLTGVDKNNDGRVDRWIFDVPAEMPVELREKFNASQPSQHRGWFSMPCQIIFDER